jgi:hypothetical protein
MIAIHDRHPVVLRTRGRRSARPIWTTSRAVAMPSVHPWSPLRSRASTAVNRPSRPPEARNRAVVGEPAAPHLADARQREGAGSNHSPRPGRARGRGPRSRGSVRWPTAPSVARPRRDRGHRTGRCFTYPSIPKVASCRSPRVAHRGGEGGSVQGLGRTTRSRSPTRPGPRRDWRTAAENPPHGAACPRAAAAVR